MNVLLVVPWDNGGGGVETVAANLAGHLQCQGHKVQFLHPGGTNFLRKRTTRWGFSGYELYLRNCFEPSHPLRSVISFSVFFFVTLYQLARLLHQYSVEVVNVHYPQSEFFYFAICRWFLPIRLVTSVHGADLFPGGRPREHYRWTLRFLLHSSDALITPSRVFFADCIRLFPSLTPKATFIHNGVDLRRLNPQPIVRQPSSYGRYLLCVAVDNEKKGVDVLIKAFAILTTFEPSLRLLLVGGGPLRSRHEVLSKTLGLEDRVTFLGWLQPDQVTALVHGCEVFVLPSRAEPFGLVVTEAMACKKPVVASAVGGIPEILDDTGILVEPDNPEALAKAVLILVRDARLRTSLANKGYTRVKDHFRIEYTGSKYERLFMDILGLRLETIKGDATGSQPELSA